MYNITFLSYNQQQQQQQHQLKHENKDKKVFFIFERISVNHHKEEFNISLYTNCPVICNRQNTITNNLKISKENFKKINLIIGIPWIAILN